MGATENFEGATAPRQRHLRKATARTRMTAPNNFLASNEAASGGPRGLRRARPRLLRSIEVLADEEQRGQLSSEEYRRPYGTPSGSPEKPK